jgi:hypothetical protein
MLATHYSYQSGSFKCLRYNTEKEEDLTMLAEQKPMLRKVVGILQELSQDEQARLLYEQQEKWRMDYSASMRNALESA